jgi:hypothetical protein
VGCGTQIKASEEEDEKSLGAKIVEKLSTCPGISFSAIATTAFHSGRRALAVSLLEYEPRATDQVPLLISMKEDELALKKAIDSGDTDLGTHHLPPPAHSLALARALTHSLACSLRARVRACLHVCSQCTSRYCTSSKPNPSKTSLR